MSIKNSRYFLNLEIYRIPKNNLNKLNLLYISQILAKWFKYIFLGNELYECIIHFMENFNNTRGS
jgi:hypothetical protein